VNKFGWYLPPVFALERADAPLCNVLKKVNKVDPFKSISSTRLYYWLTKIKGSRLDICIPYADMANNMDIAGALLYRLSGGRHRTLYECAYALETGYDLNEVYETLQDKLGGFFKFKEEHTLGHGIVELFQGAMGSSLDNCYPWHERGQSFLTGVSPDGMSLCRYKDMPDGVALFFATEESYDTSPGELDSWTYVPIRELENKFSSRKAGPLDNKKEQQRIIGKNDLAEDEIRQLEYFQAMMKGALGHLSMAFSSHTTEAITHPGVDSYASVFDDSEDEGIGTMFG
jgi:hypothetical protein